MTPASQLIWRNRHRIDKQAPALLVAPAADDLPARLAAEDFRIEASCLSRAALERLQAAGLEPTFGLDSPRAGRFRTIVLFQPREKALLEMLLHFCASLLEPDGALWLVGENRAGIKSAARRLDGHFGRASKLDNARHCVLFAGHEPAGDRPFSLDDYFVTWPLDVAGRTLTVFSLPGVFAHGRLDPGTRALLHALMTRGRSITVAGRVLDFACGSGVIGLALAAAFPDIELTLLDDSALALESARRTITANGFEAQLVASDGLSGLPMGPARYDWIASNPPFHAGVRQHAGTVRSFLHDCPRLLRPNGRLCLVSNAHLPYGRWLSELFGDVQVIAADSEYNVWLAAGQIENSKTRTS